MPISALNTRRSLVSSLRHCTLCHNACPMSVLRRAWTTSDGERRVRSPEGHRESTQACATSAPATTAPPPHALTRAHTTQLRVLRTCVVHAQPVQRPATSSTASRTPLSVKKESSLVKEFRRSGVWQHSRASRRAISDDVPQCNMGQDERPNGDRTQTISENTAKRAQPLQKTIPSFFISHPSPIGIHERQLCYSRPHLPKKRRASRDSHRTSKKNKALTSDGDGRGLPIMLCSLLLSKWLPRDGRRSLC